MFCYLSVIVGEAGTEVESSTVITIPNKGSINQKGGALTVKRALTIMILAKASKGLLILFV